METEALEARDARLLAARSGDQQAFEDLLAAYAPLIETLVSSFASPDAEYRDDFRQEACIAFYSALRHYDMEQETIPFGAYAKTCMKNRLISYARTLRRRGTPLPLECGDGADNTSDPGQTLVEEENYLALYRRIEEALSPYENRVWWLYLSGRTAREIASMLGKEERSVANAIYRIRKKLRTTLPNP